MLHLDINLPPNFVVTLIFLVFDVVTLALVEHVLAHVVNRAYYLRVVSGNPIIARSTDLPGRINGVCSAIIYPLYLVAPNSAASTPLLSQLLNLSEINAESSWVSLRTQG